MCYFISGIIAPGLPAFPIFFKGMLQTFLLSWSGQIIWLDKSIFLLLRHFTWILVHRSLCAVIYVSLVSSQLPAYFKTMVIHPV